MPIMAIPLPVPTHQQHTQRSATGSRSPMSPANLGLYSPLSSSLSMPSQYGHSCAITILKGDKEHPIHAHAPIHQKEDLSKPQDPARQPSRFASSFSNLRSATQAASSGFDSSVNVHAVSDQGILLPFLDRPSEVKELLFETKVNEALMSRLCRVFGGDPERPTLRGVDERWDEMLQLLIELDRPLLDDEDWLVRLESLVMERSPSLWAQLQRCLGAEGLALRPAAAQPSSSRFDSWALPSSYAGASHDTDSPLSPPSASSSEDDEERRNDRSMSVSVEPLDALPQSYSEQPAGKMHQSSLRQANSPGALPKSLEAEAPSPRFAEGQASLSGIFPMSAGADDSTMSGSLEDIMEEGSSTQDHRVTPRRARSHSGKFAGLRISAMSSNSPPTSRRTSNASDSLPSSARRDGSSSPLPTGSMSPAGLGPVSGNSSPNNTTSTSFSKHRRLSTMMKQNNSAHQDLHHSDANVAASPKSRAPRRQRGTSEVGHSLQSYSFQSQPRRRAQSFARSFAELKSPTEHLEQLRAEHAKAEEDKLAEGTRRISLKDTHNGLAAASAPAAPTSGLGLHEGDNSSLLDPASAALKPRRASTGRKRAGSRADASSTGSNSPPIPGLLPDGRTRHPSGSCGSRDLSESIAAFRATMGFSISPSPSEHGDSVSDAGSATRKRKGSGGSELPKPTSRTSSAVEAKISRKGSLPTSTSDRQQYQHPKDMQDMENRNKASGSSGSGLALGGGFSLAKSGANFRRPSQEAASRSSFAARSVARTRGDPYSFRSPPAVHRRPGGFAGLAQEYELARQRRASESVFSIHSNAVESSPSSSIASLDVDTGRSHRLSSDDAVPQLSLSSEDGSHQRDLSTPEIVKGDPTPKANPNQVGGGITPRASFTRMASGSQGYPFPNLLNRLASEDIKMDSLRPAAPLSPLQACRTRLSPSPSFTGSGSGSSSGSSSPRSPTIVFPISPNPSISRAREFRKAVDTPMSHAAFERIAAVAGDKAAEEVKDLITTSERTHLPDEALLEEVAKKLGLVDHEKARQVGGREAEEADQILAEEGYEERWEAFSGLCKVLGVGQYELGLAKKRCGPAIDLCR